MNELKMSDVFCGEVEAKGFYVSDVDFDYLITRHGEDVAKYAAHAINSHDKLTADNKRLREALQRIVVWNELSVGRVADIGSNGERDYYRDIAEKALAQTEEA